MTWEIRQGDCRALMAAMDRESVDAIVTDPPYGLEFMGREWDHGVPGVPFWIEALRVLKPGGHLVAFGGTRTYHRLACAIEDAGFEVRDCLMWLYGSGFPKSLDVSKAIDKAAGAEREWQGWGTALKPAWEPIILARKPLVGTVAANVQEHGTGALNIDGCRLRVDADEPNRRNAPGKINSKNLVYGAESRQQRGPTLQTGRWPANLVLDEEAGAMLDEQSGERPSSGGSKGRMGYHGAQGWKDYIDVGRGDSGGASRFFYTAKASSGERHYAGKNAHPTVKPVDLMQWLCRLVTPKGGLVLDPFMGSGSTGVAALAEGFRFLGMEQDAEHCVVARRRIAGPLFAEPEGATL